MQRHSCYCSLYKRHECLLWEDESRMSQDDIQKALKKYEGEVEAAVQKRSTEIKTL